MNNIRIGVIGTGRIAARFLAETDVVPYAQISAVYNPRVSSTVFFAERNDIKGAVIAESEEELFSLADAVYIAAPHDKHAYYIEKALLGGKHVLCEKPMVLNSQDAIRLFNIAKEKSLILMEAVKTAYCPGFVGLLELVKGGAVGMVHDVEACFTKIGAASGREIWGEYGGSFYELGTYPLLPVVKLLGRSSLESYIWSYDSVVGSDSYCKMVISYENATSSLKTGLGVKSEGELIIAGEKGYIRVPSPWWITKRIEVHHEDPGRVEVCDYPYEGAGLRYEILSFVKKIYVMNEYRDKLKSADGSMPDSTECSSKHMSISDACWDEISGYEGLTPDESIWMACQMEIFGEYRGRKAEETEKQTAGQIVEWTQEQTQEQTTEHAMDRNKDISITNIRFWGHRGCSMRYPENTLLSLEAAAKVKGITGIELDVQLTKDCKMVVIHDERIDRTTTGSGYVKDYTLDELKQFDITPSGKDEAYRPDINECSNPCRLTVPTLAEVFETLKPYCVQNGLMINIELKNSIIPYDGMEKMVINLVHEYELQDYIVYSSFNHSSMALIKEIDSSARTGLLGSDELLCLEDMEKYNADAVHPANTGLAINPETVQTLREKKIPVRMWNGEEPLLGQSRELKGTDFTKYAALGVTDIITNIPELYLK